MENAECVRVAVNIRPLITSELLIGCTDCITVVPGEPQVQIGSHTFTYDFVYGSKASPSSKIYDQCVAPLVDALFRGYNATVLAYGQTGSGKTYTMGTNYSGDGNSGGVIPKVVENIFSRVEAMKDTEFLIRVSFIEIFKEEVFDLLDSSSAVSSKSEGVNVAKPAVPARVPIQIRETVNGGITLAGVTEAEVRTKEEMGAYLSRGSLSRATGSTNMNSQSSRSHAIFTITMEQKKISRCPGRMNDDFADDILCAKLHLVDLAGSERAKRTGADGLRLKEGIHINKGLLALGNVISALGDEKKRKEGCHVPYRDSKLTRLLQDSLGGNSKTVMIACVSPADTNAEETLNTLKYANRARNIQNKAVVNHDPTTAQIQRMKSQIEQLQAELLFYRGDATMPMEELQILKHKVSLLEASNTELKRELQERQITCEHLSKRAIDVQVEKDKLLMQIEAARNGKSWNEIESDSTKDSDLVRNYLSRIQELEGELLRSKMVNSRHHSTDCTDSDDEQFNPRNGLFPPNDIQDVDISDDVEVDEKEIEHSSLQEKLDRELKELDERLEQKEAEMKQYTNGDTSVLKHHYEKKVQELEQEKKALQKEIEQLRHNLANMSSSDDGTQKLKEEYLQKLTLLESQVAELKKKQDAQAQLLRQKQKSDEAARRLNEEIQRIKTQKVQLQQKIKQESEHFRLWKAAREKEVLQLKKEGRRNEYELHKLLALNQRQKLVLQRKTEEAAAATRRLKELLESRKANSAASGNGPGLQNLIQAIEHELEVTVRVHEVRLEYERQIEVRERMAQEIGNLKDEQEKLKQNSLSNYPATMSPGARNSRIYALENMLATSSSTLVSMASQLSEAEERERKFSGRGRWNHVRSVAEAKTLMNHLFNLASNSRCLLRDKEVECREKDSEMRDLKGKVVKLNKLVRDLEMQKADLVQQLKSQQSAVSKLSQADYMRRHNYDLRKQAYRSSVMLLEDMDISDTDDEEWVVSDEESMKAGRFRKKKRNSKNEASSSNVVFVNDPESNKSGPSAASSNARDANDPENNKSGGSLIVEVNETKADCTEVCCTCSRSSLCKTVKCQCRAAKGFCGVSCGCVSSKCSNRENAVLEISDGSDDSDKTHVLVTEGAMLLRSALVEKPAVNNEDGEAKRKPLSDIGNTVAKSNAPKPNNRKKWRKSVIQLVPVAPPPSTPSENTEAPQKPENGGTVETDVPLKLPRAMRSAAASNSSLLREKNGDQSNESVNKESNVPPTRSPSRPPKTTTEKENYRR